MGGGIAVDGSLCAYVTGPTNSTDFPTQGEYQTYRGGEDVFVTKLNSAGDSLVYSTYLGGSNDDWGGGIAVDGSGCAYVTGRTNSTDFPIQGEHQADQGGGDRGSDAFVTKLNSAGSGLVYSTYLGGYDWDCAKSIAVDGSGCAYVTGETYSSDFPIQGEYQTYNGGYYDAFVTKFASSGACCAGTMVGDVNCADDPGKPDIGDMQELIDKLFVNIGPPYCCIEEADVDTSGQAHPPAVHGDVDIADMQLLIDHLFIDMDPLLPCP